MNYNIRFEDKRTIRHLKEKFVSDKVYNDVEKCRDYRNILVSFFYKYADYLKLNHILQYIPTLVDKDTFTGYCDILIDNL